MQSAPLKNQLQTQHWQFTIASSGMLHSAYNAWVCCALISQSTSLYACISPYSGIMIHTFPIIFKELTIRENSGSGMGYHPKLRLQQLLKICILLYFIWKQIKYSVIFVSVINQCWRVLLQTSWLEMYNSIYPHLHCRTAKQNPLLQNSINSRNSLKSQKKEYQLLSSKMFRSP